MSAEFNFPDRNLALELVRVTETAAIAASAWVGRGDKDSADAAAVTAMRKMINTVDMSGLMVPEMQVIPFIRTIKKLYCIKYRLEF